MLTAAKETADTLHVFCSVCDRSRVDETIECVVQCYWLRFEMLSQPNGYYYCPSNQSEQHDKSNSTPIPSDPSSTLFRTGLILLSLCKPSIPDSAPCQARQLCRIFAA